MLEGRPSPTTTGSGAAMRRGGSVRGSRRVALPLLALVGFVVVIGIVGGGTGTGTLPKHQRGVGLRTLTATHPPLPSSAEKQSPEKTTEESCECPRHCIVASCSSSSSSVPVFQRCPKGACVRNQRTGTCDWPVGRAAEAVQCLSADAPPTVRTAVEAVQRCAVPGRVLPKVFTVEDDVLTGLKLACPGHVPHDTCRGLTEAAADTFRDVRSAAAGSQSTPRSGGVRRSVLLVDVGRIDALLAARAASIPGVDVAAWSMSPADTRTLQLTQCLNSFDEHHLSVTPLNATNVVAVRTAAEQALVARSNHTNAASLAVLLRISAIGYEDAMAGSFDTLRTVLKPHLVIAHAAPKAMATVFLRGTELYYGYNPVPSECRVARSEDSLASVGLYTSSTRSLWVRSDQFQALLPSSCSFACAVLACRDGWRTEYEACGTEASCVAGSLLAPRDLDQLGLTVNDGCFWRHSALRRSRPCPRDSNADRVHRCLSPHLPVPRFSIVDVQGFLAACEGARECNGLDTARFRVHKQAGIIANAQLGAVKGLRAAHLFVGVPLGLMAVVTASTENGPVFLLEPNPAERQLARTSICVNRLDDRATVYDFVPAEHSSVCMSSAWAKTLPGGGGAFAVCPSSDPPPHSDAPNWVTFKSLDDAYVEELGPAAAERTARVGGSSQPPSFIVHLGRGVDAAAMIRGASSWIANTDRRPFGFVVDAPPTTRQTVRDALLPRGYHHRPVDRDEEHREHVLPDEHQLSLFLLSLKP